MPAVSKRKSLAPIDSKLLRTFKDKMGEYYGLRGLHSEVSEKLFTHLGLDFFDKSAEERCQHLLLKVQIPAFANLLRNNARLAYVLLKKGVDSDSALVELLEQGTVGTDIITPSELDSYHQEVCQKLGNSNINLNFAAWMYEYLGRKYFSLTPELKCKKLSGLQFGDECDREVAYKLLMQSANQQPELLTFLKDSLIWGFVIPVEADLFHQRLIQILSIPCDRMFSNTLFKHLGLDYLNKNPSEQLSQLKAASTELVNFLRANQVLADDFLCHSLEKYPTLFVELQQDSALKACLISPELKVFHQKMKALTKLDLTCDFTNKLSKYVSADFWSQTPVARYNVLSGACKGKKGAEFINLLRENSKIIDSFLRESVGNAPSLVEQLHTHSHLGGFLRPDRRVRKRAGLFLDVPGAKSEVEEVSEVESNKRCSIAPIPRLTPFSFEGF